jgi:hypothetical protein
MRTVTIVVVFIKKSSVGDAGEKGAASLSQQARHCGFGLGMAGSDGRILLDMNLISCRVDRGPHFTASAVPGDPAPRLSALQTHSQKSP